MMGKRRTESDNFSELEEFDVDEWVEKLTDLSDTSHSDTVERSVVPAWRRIEEYKEDRWLRAQLEDVI
jgi:hypothetical protein